MGPPVDHQRTSSRRPAGARTRVSPGRRRWRRSRRHCCHRRRPHRCRCRRCCRCRCLRGLLFCR
ncbi:unnamed protein product [Spirodela intermedia]|uniref:Sperm protamine P1 n=1 Tax=Spirodela intermedia TaxID=51605 RepID=A0ABN7E975_SPIIN|nr:unnamed protein product [Spirodela intermedia]